jgi:D-xylose transport system permease protein
MLMVIVAGQIDLSVGSLLGLAGAVAAIGLTGWGFGLPAALASAVIIGGLIGLLHGALTAYLNIPAFIVTLGGLLAWRGAVKAITQSETIPIADPIFKSIGQSYIPQQVGWMLAGAGVMFVLAIALRRRARKSRIRRSKLRRRAVKDDFAGRRDNRFYLRDERLRGHSPCRFLFSWRSLCSAFFITGFTTFGRYLYAIGGNAEAARLSGIDNKRNILKVLRCWAR